MSIVMEVQKVIQKSEEKLKECQKCGEYEDMIKKYKEMVDAGITKPRGNNLLPIEDRFSSYHEIN